MTGSLNVPALFSVTIGGDERVVQILVPSERFGTLAKSYRHPTEAGDRGTALQVASFGGHEGTVRMLVAAGANVNAQDESDEGTALHIAVQEGHIKVAEVLLNHGADKNAFTKKHETPLHIASYNGEAGPVMALLEHGADTGMRTDDDYTALHIAAQKGHVQAVEPLLKYGADTEARVRENWTALHVAAQAGHVKVVQLLLNHGADTNAYTKTQATALHIASGNGNVNTIKLLLEHGADIEARSRDDYTALHIAAQKGHVQAVELLLKYGADTEAMVCEDWTALHIVAQEGHIKVVELLLNHGVDVNDTTKIKPATALHIASSNGDLNMAKVLLENGANSEVRVGEDYTALHLAAQNGHVKVVELLLNHGVDVNDTTKIRRATALHIASANSHINIVKLLLDRYADRDLRDDIGNNALHATADRKALASCDMLLAVGFDINCVNDFGQTPLHIAIHARDWDLSRFLSSRQADCSHLDRFGRSPSYWLEMYGHAPNSWLHSQPPMELDQTRLQIHLWQSVQHSLLRLASSPVLGQLDWYFLGKCLSILNERENAAVSFEQQILSSQPLKHLASCNNCERNTLICGIRHICCQCFDTDLCETCFDKRDSLVDLGKQCRDHNYLAVPRREFSSLDPGTVNLDGTTMSQWIESMQTLTTKTLGELSRDHSLTE